MTRRANLIHARSGSRAFTLVEAAVSVVLVGMLFTAALTTAGAARTSQYIAAVSARGQFLAQSLMAEILQQNYADPEDPTGFGLEGEASDTRQAFDDVDDYDDWSASPPQQKDGAVLANHNGWKRMVKVDRVLPEDPSQSSPTETGAKKIEVNVSCGGTPAASLTAIKTRPVE